MALSWKDLRPRPSDLVSKVMQVFWVSVIFLFSELVIWGLSWALAPTGLQFFGSILSMLVVFVAMTIAQLLCGKVEGVYGKHVKPKADFINAHLGVGFTVPLITMNPRQMLGGVEIARIIGNFVLTSVVSWILVYAVAVAALLFLLVLVSSGDGGEFGSHHGMQIHCSPRGPRGHEDLPEASVISLGSHADPRWSSTVTKRLSGLWQAQICTRRGSSEPLVSDQTKDARFPFTAKIRTLLLPLLLVFIVGIPVAAATKDSRLLDGFVLWTVWLFAVRSQQAIAYLPAMDTYPRMRRVLATLANPVLLTALLMIGYTRVKAAMLSETDLQTVLEDFSRGNPLYAIWTAEVTNDSSQGYFGAGDAALALLECGIFVWGFKLFECRTQLFSVIGAFVCVLSVAAAAANVFLCVLSAAAIGLHAPESLAFSARSTTLALAKPAVETLGGNIAVNAALVVSNGIVGQLMYPFVLDWLNVQENDTQAAPEECEDRGELSAALNEAERGEGYKEACVTTIPLQTPDDSRSASPEPQIRRIDEEDSREDTVATIAAGVAVGINGAAMGVAYLYGKKSQAAPYAALAMTVFGVFTVVFATVQPFRASLENLAH